jgi:CrcB protein
VIGSIIWVGIGGFFGAVSRFGLSQWLGKKSKGFPLATLAVNLLGSFLLGWMNGANIAKSWSLLLGTGFMGAFTTFSTFKWESVKMAKKKEWNKLIVYLGLSYTLGVLLAYLGYIYGRH